VSVCVLFQGMRRSRRWEKWPTAVVVPQVGDMVYIVPEGSTAPDKDGVQALVLGREISAQGHLALIRVDAV
jgi:hypothetical protein